jgi:putative transposase
MANSKQLEFRKTNWAHRYAHGGSLRNKRAGRKERPIKSHASIHLVMKANKECIKGGFRNSRRFLLIHRLRDRYAKRFFIRVEQMSVQGDHVHLIIRTARRSGLQNFLRVFSGQIAQQVQRTGLANRVVTDTPARQNPKARIGLWKHRPFTRVIVGRRALVTLQNYVQLNEREAEEALPYRKERLAGLREDEWRILWS